jgi:hypothetical protein
MIIGKDIDFRSFYQNLRKIRKIDHSRCLGIVYDSILPFEQFLIGVNFDPSAEAHMPAPREERSPPQSVMQVAGVWRSEAGRLRRPWPPLTRPPHSGGLLRAAGRPTTNQVTVNFKLEYLEKSSDMLCWYAGMKCSPFNSASIELLGNWFRAFFDFLQIFKGESLKTA